MKTNDKGLEIIKFYEGYRGKSYKCPAGVWTIGYGHTSSAGAPKVVEGMVLTEGESSELLRKDIRKYEKAVMEALGSSIKQLNSNQFSALVSLCYNIGPGAFKRSSCCRYIKQGKVKAAATRIPLWNKAGGKVLRGLVKRRNAERLLYLSTEE